ncbi:MAG: beta-galactosidase [Clostridiaceae bacterium]|nr:beta-galactosidase [Clostridiaceae bacterium]
MNSLAWNHDSYLFNHLPGFLVSGEFHYFRVPQEDWSRRLDLFIEAGGNCVATYIPWILHEPEEGLFQFGGAPELDLEAFLRLCQEKKLYVLCRPGPYQYSEIKYDGLPGWLCEHYPEILARDIQGRAFRKSSVSYLHPVFLEKARRWFDVVCPILAPYMLSRGGCIAMVQFDNELMGIHEWFGSLDYNPETMGFGCESGRYPCFLKKKYQDLRQLNQAYGTSYTSFAEVMPYQGEPSVPADRRRVKDYQDFYFTCTAEYAGILTSWMAGHGLDGIKVHNSGSPSMNAYFRETAAQLKPDFILGSDHYYNLNMDWAQNNPTPQYAAGVFRSYEMLRLMGFPATVFELPGGSASEWPPITAEDLKCCYWTNLALGMKGLNYYIFTGGQNPRKIGADGDSYDYSASIDKDGHIRPSYAVQKELGLFLKQNAWLAAAHHIADFYIGLDWEQARSNAYPSAAEAGIDNRQAWKLSQKGMLISGLCASFSPDFVDLPDSPLAASCCGKPLFVATSACMSRRIQENLVAFVRQGGKLLLAPGIPEYDEQFNRCTILQDFLGGAAARRAPADNPRVMMQDIANIPPNVSLWRCTEQPPEARILAVEENTGAVAAWQKDYGAGSVIWLGLEWMHAKTQHAAMIRYLLSQLGCQTPVVACDNPNLWTFLRGDGQNRMLFILNLFTAPMTAGICLQNGDKTPEIREINIAPLTVLTIDKI